VRGLGMATFEAVLSPKLIRLLPKIARKDPKLSNACAKKIRQVCSCDEELIGHYKNMKHGLKDYKRVHVDKSFVLLFKVDFKGKKVLFAKLDHHDNVYK